MRTIDFKLQSWRRWTTEDEETNEADMPEEGTPKEEPPEDPVLAKDRQIADLTNDLKRIQAEFDNYKKRVEKEWSERSKAATQKLMTDLLAVLDSFDKALENSETNCKDDSFMVGLEGLHKQFLQILQRHGLKEIKAEGQFDPFVHEALMREEREDVEDGKILEVFQKGYSLGSKPLRPTRVKVAKKKEPAEEENHNHDEQADKESEKEEDDGNRGD